MAATIDGTIQVVDASPWREAATPCPVPTISLLSAVPDGPLALVLTFDRPPGGAYLTSGSYQIVGIGAGAGVVPNISSMALVEVAPPGYSHAIRLEFVDQFSGDDTYEVTVQNLTGACGEALGDATAQFVATSVAPRVLDGGFGPGLDHVWVEFSRTMTGIADPGDWDISPEGGGAPIAVTAVGGTTTRPVLELAAAMDPETEYRVTAPAAAMDGSGTVLDATYDHAIFTTPAEAGPLTIVSVATGSLVVTFSDAIGGGSWDDLDAWELTVLDGAADLPEIEGASLDGDTISLALSCRLTPGGTYRIQVPFDLENSNLEQIAPGDAVKDFLVPLTDAPPAVTGFLAAWTGALGRALARIVGTPTTRLRALLQPTDTTARVETTLWFSETGGTAVIGSEVVQYGGITSGSITGLIRSGLVFDPWPIGTTIQDQTRHWSLRDRAWSETRMSVAPPDFVDSLAADLGARRPIAQMSIEDVRQFARALYYLDNGTWWAVFRVLRWMFRWASRSGSDGVARSPAPGEPANLLDIPTTSLSGRSMADRWVIVNGSICRVINATVAGDPAVTTLMLEPADGPFWQAPGLVAGQTGVAWEVLAYRIEETQWRPTGIRKSAFLRITLFAGAPSRPATYLLTSGLAADQGMPARGKLMADATVPGPGRHAFYLAQPYATVTRAVLRDVVSAGVEVVVVSRTATT